MVKADVVKCLCSFPIPFKYVQAIVYIYVNCNESYKLENDEETNGSGSMVLRADVDTIGRQKTFRF